jgi:hypothetical protein
MAGLAIFIGSVVIAFVAGYQLRAYLSYRRRMMYGGRPRRD